MSALQPLPPARPAGFWLRAAAWSLDAAVIAPASLLASWAWLRPAALDWWTRMQALLESSGTAMGEAILDGTPLPLLATALLHDPALADGVTAVHLASWQLAAPVLLTFALLAALWNVAGECSPWRGSPGKRLLRLQVECRHGGVPGLGRALWRHVAGSVSWATLNLGHLLAAAAPEHLALHDRISGTRVVSAAGAPTRLPRWARAWLALLCAASFAMVAWLANEASAAMRAGLERALF